MKDGEEPDLRGQPYRLDDEKRALLWREDDVLIVWVSRPRRCQPGVER